MAVDVPLDQSRAFEELPNSWKLVKASDHEVRDTVIYTCPNGHTGWLESWVINEAGDVSPSVRCGECHFHDHLHLLDWSSNASPVV